MQTKPIIIIVLGITLALLTALGIKKYYIVPVAPETSAVMNLNNAMRELWAQHVIWTREYIVAAVADAPDTKDVTERLLRNQQDIGNAIVPYYGKNAGKKLTDLLKQHILLAADVVTAAKEGDQGKLIEADKRWHDNAQEIATFLSNANPHWPQTALVDMLNEHLSLTTQEATAHIKKQWQKDIEAFDSIFAQIMTMADSLTSGIVKQFPDKF